MQEDLGANIKVVNKEGGSQVVGLNYVAQAKPDGLTFGYTNIPSILGRYLDPSKKAAFDRSSFTPIGSFATNSVVIGVNKDSKYKTIKELFDAVKAEPGKITVGTDSRAGDDHINLRLLEDQLGLDFNIVHYNSGADKVAAIVSGEIDFALGGVSSFFGQYKSGDIKLLTVVEDSRQPLRPGSAHDEERRLRRQAHGQQLRPLRPVQDAQGSCGKARVLAEEGHRRPRRAGKAQGRGHPARLEVRRRRRPSSGKSAKPPSSRSSTNS